MSAIQLLEVQFCLFVTVSLVFLLLQEWKRQTSTAAQLGRAWKRYETWANENKGYFLQAYSLIIGLIQTEVTSTQLANAAENGNKKADEVLAALNQLVTAIKAVAEKSDTAE